MCKMQITHKKEVKSPSLCFSLYNSGLFHVHTENTRDVYRCAGHLWASCQENSTFKRIENSSAFLGEKRYKVSYGNELHGGGL